MTFRSNCFAVTSVTAIRRAMCSPCIQLKGIEAFAGAYAQRATLFPMRAPRHGGRARDLPIRFLADVI
jgi:hypothetical protein